MSLEITHREREGIAILDLKGRIVMGDETHAFREAAELIIAAPGSRLIINMKLVDFVDSTGLGVVVTCATSAAGKGGAAKLVNVNRRQLELIILTKLDTIFEIFDDETDAVSSFFPHRKIRRFDILSFVRKIDENKESANIENDGQSHR